MTATRRLAPLAVALALSGCISFGAKPPPSAIRLQSAEHAPADAGQTLAPDRAVTVMIPHGPNELGVLRVAVRSGSARLAYLKDAQFADSPYRLLRDLFAETIQARTGRPALDGRNYHYAPGDRLVTEVADFSVDADRHQVDLVIDAILQQTGNKPVLTRRFEAHAPVGAIDADSVGPALGVAANQVAQQVADWIGR